MRFPSMLAGAALVATLSGCANIPFMNNIPLWNGDPDKIAALGKGTPVARIDKTLGRTHVLWSNTMDVNGTPYQFRLYDWVERSVQVGQSTHCSNTGCVVSPQMRYDMLPYAIVYAGAEPRLYAWGTLSELRDSDDPIVLAALPQLTSHYNEYQRSR